jgi:hypothetical protein
VKRQIALIIFLSFVLIQNGKAMQSFDFAKCPAGLALPQLKLTYSALTFSKFISHTIEQGVACLAKMPSDSPGKAIADDLTRLELKSTTPVSVTCQPGNDAFCGLSSLTTDPKFPNITFSDRCNLPNAGAYPAAVLHEFLHLSSDATGKQRVHSDSSLDFEVVEPCAQCCAPSSSNVSQRNAFC